MKRIKLSEEQDRLIQQFLKEDGSNGLKNNIKVIDTGDGTVTSAEAQQTLKDNTRIKQATGKNVEHIEVNKQDENKPLDQQRATIVTDTGSAITESESLLITKKQLSEAKLRKLKSNSQVIKVKNFMK